MAPKVEVYQKEKVRPCSPTPEAFRNYKLSLLDQIAGTFYIPLVFFYDSGAGPQSHDYDELKQSLSKTLSVLYPLAGRLKDGLTIECNDEGADFFRANVTNYDLGDLLRLPKLDFLRQLFPRDPYPMAFDPAQPMLAVQANRFRCGGTTVAICLWHAVADAAGLAGFLHSWAAITRGKGATNRVSGLIVDATRIFKPVNFDFYESISSFAARRKSSLGKYSAKRFFFREQEIQRLKDEYNQSEYRRPTRVEALSALIWAAVIRATLQTKENLKMHLLTNVVELRKRMNPPFPWACLGNINQVCATRWEADGADKHAGVVTAQSLTGRVREAIGKVTDDYVKKMHEEVGYLKAITAGQKLAHNFNDNKILSISSLGKFPFLEIDFGWGKPIWVGPALNLEDMALLLDTTVGGVEVWIGLPQPVMWNLDEDNEFLAYVSFSQIVWEPLYLPSRL